jgi:hypothetical protein
VETPAGALESDPAAILAGDAATSEDIRRICEKLERYFKVTT